MRCIRCGKKSTININHLRPLCDNCFTRIIEKRIRKYLRINRLIRAGDRLLITDPLSLYFIKRIIKSPIKIFNKYNKDINKIIIPWSLDDECNLFLYNFLKPNFNINIDYKKKRKEIKLFKTVTNEELIEFSKVKNIKYKPLDKNKEIEKLLNNLKKYPEIRFSLLKCIENMERLKE